MSAISFIGGDTIVYSRYIDYCEYRILTKGVDSESGKTKWVETAQGPLIDRKEDKIFLVLGIHYIETDLKNTSNLIIISLRGPS